MELARIDLSKHVLVADTAPWAAGIASLPPETWADLTDRGYPGIGYWPIVDEAPGYEPTTQMLGAETLTVDVASRRVVRTWAVAAKPVTVPDRIPMRNAKRVMVRRGWMAPVQAFLASLPGIDGDLARLDFAEALTMRRDNPLVTQAMPAMGVPESEIDAAFIEAYAESLED